MVDLTTSYLGLELKNPLVVSASPLASDINKVRQMEAAGAAAVVLPSLFEEQIRIENKRLSRYVPYATNPLPEGLRHIPDMSDYNWGINGYIVHLYEARKAVDIPIIASLNAYQSGGWTGLARILEGAGADALELNIYHLATNPHQISVKSSKENQL